MTRIRPSAGRREAEFLERPPTMAVLNLAGRNPEIEQAHNITSVTDCGAGRGKDFGIALTFGEDFSDDLYACQVSANREVAYEIVAKTPGSVRLVIKEPVPNRIKIICFNQ